MNDLSGIATYNRRFLGPNLVLQGELMQSSMVADMIFSLPEIIAYISHMLPLVPGDFIATGSPDGTGGGRNSPVFLKAGDLVQVSVTGGGN